MAFDFQKTKPSNAHKRISKSLTAILMASVFSAGIATLPANAQKTTATADGSIVTYDQEYFVTYAPVTLLDMLERVPGVPEILNKNRQQRRGGGANSQGERGFGSGGDQILIDGKRLAGKANNIEDTLGRISSAQVDRVELIRGAAEGLDVQSQGLVVNIILAEGASTASTFWKLTSETKRGHEAGLEFLLSHSNSFGNLDYTVSGERTSNNGFFDRTDTFFDNTDTETGQRKIDSEFNFRGFKFNTNLTYNFESGAVLRLNGLYEPRTMKGEEIRIETGDDPEDILWLTDEDTDKWELGGDYSHNLGRLGQFKALFVVNQDKEDRVVERSVGSPGIAQFQNIGEIETEKKTEKIFRASLTEKITDAQSIEFGGEAAINTFDSRFDRSERDVATDPLLFEINRSDNVEIQENRYELFANHTYNFSSALVLQSSLITEFSNIIADNILPDGTINRRDTKFTYFKPRVNLRYDIDGQNQIRATVERKVSQLNFNSFVAEFDQRSEEFRIGNTNIVPERLWEFMLTFEHRLANDAGSIEIEPFYRRYTDYITQVDFTEYQDIAGNIIGREAFFALPASQTDIIRDVINDTGSGFIRASGNVDKATSYGLNVKTNLRLGFIGLPQATFSTTYTYEKPSVIDQFTREKRPFDRTNRHRVSIDYRHDITDLGFSYGGRLSFNSDGETNDIRYNWPFSPQANISLFAEYLILDGIKLRVDAKQLAGRRGVSNRFNYVDHIRFGEFSSQEERRTNAPQEVEISIQGTF